MQAAGEQVALVSLKGVVIPEFCHWLGNSKSRKVVAGKDIDDKEGSTVN